MILFDKGRIILMAKLNKKILSFMVKGYFKDVAKVDDYLNLVESEELSDLTCGRDNANIPKAIAITPK